MIIETCPPLLSDGLDIKCTLNGTYANCSNPSIPNTIAIQSCKPTHGLPNGQKWTPIELRCQSNGTWNNHLYECTPCNYSVYWLLLDSVCFTNFMNYITITVSKWLLYFFYVLLK
jgi:hypothetical protein